MLFLSVVAVVVVVVAFLSVADVAGVVVVFLSVADVAAVAFLSVVVAVMVAFLSVAGVVGVAFLSVVVVVVPLAGALTSSLVLEVADPAAAAADEDADVGLAAELVLVSTVVG